MMELIPGISLFCGGTDEEKVQAAGVPDGESKRRTFAPGSQPSGSFEGLTMYLVLGPAALVQEV